MPTITLTTEQLAELRPNTDEGQYVLVRTAQAGVFAGTLVSRDHDEVTLADARRIYYWAGAATLSELAMRGTSKPRDCKFPVAVSEVLLIGVIEIIAVSAPARLSIEGVPVWTA